ncbi:hypothetical protein [Shimazuella alba]|uniref:Uncharacterized protein n=1 Tax=Shimazuella alba TaxID=2690964 RepID=A0A6I4W0F4_9BACL|nr:hypothetical protein [Shimazuella alba]MXQ55456.1 hypothetical protein [Shimazuella alba]
MIKSKVYTWLIQVAIIFIFIFFYWGGVFSINVFTSGAILSLAGIILVPISILFDYLTKKLPLLYYLSLSFLIHLGSSMLIFLDSLGWILVNLYGGLFWSIDGIFKWKQSNKCKCNYFKIN